MIRYNIDYSRQYEAKTWAALSKAYPLTSVYIRNHFPGDGENMPWNASNGYGNMGAIYEYCQRFGFAARTFGHCDEVMMIVYTGGPAYISIGAHPLIAGVLDVLFSQLEPLLASLVEKGLPLEPPLRELPESFHILIRAQESATLEMEPFMEHISVPALRFKMEKAGIPYVDYVFGRTLVWRKDLSRIEALLR